MCSTLGQSENDVRLRMALDVAELGVIDINYNSDESTPDLRAGKLFGLEPGIAVKRSLLHSRFHQEDRETVMALMSQALDPRGSGTFSAEHRIVLPDGCVKWLGVKKLVTFADIDGARRPSSGLLVAMDITARREAERARHDKNERLSLVGRVARYLIVESGTETRILDTVFKDVADSIGADLCFYYQPESVSTLRLQSSTGLTEDEKKTFAEVRFGELLFGRIAESRESIVIHDVSSTVIAGSEHLRDLGYSAYAGFPLVAQNRLLGIVGFVSRRNTGFRWRDLSMVEAVCSLVAATMDRGRLLSELSVNEQRYRTLIDATSVVTWVCPPHGKVTEPQYSWMAFTGQAAEEMCGDGWTAAVHPDDVARSVQQWRRSVQTGVPFSIEYRIRRHDGEWRWMNVNAALVKDKAGASIEWIGMCLDITDRKLAEDRLKAADKTKDKFLATLAHELRNPLTPICGGLDIMRIAHGDSETVETARQLIERQVEQLTRLVDDLLDISRISLGKIVLQKTRNALAPVIRNAVDAIQGFADQKEQTVTIFLPSDPIFVEGDYTRLCQIFTNLLNNAVKYSENGGKIEVAVTQSNSMLTIRISDNGIGIPQSMLDAIFEMFSQVDSSLEKTHGGLGIGLNLAKRLVELHGGEIYAESDGLGRGSTFVVTLPCSHSEQSSSLDEQIDTESSVLLRRILVVDDNSDVVKVLVRLLRYMGHTVSSASDGLEACSIAEEMRPEIIFMDLGMPNLNGYESCRRIRSQGWASSIAIVALTGWNQEEYRRLASEAGFNYHLTKPVSYNSLQQFLANMETESRLE